MSSLPAALDREASLAGEGPDHEWYAAVAAGIEELASLPEAERRAVRGALTTDRSWALAGFAWSASILAIRREDPALVALGLAALAYVAAAEQIDGREALVHVPLCRAAAVGLRRDLDALDAFLGEAARYTDAAGAEWLESLRGYGVDPDQMGWRRTGEGESVTFERTW